MPDRQLGLMEEDEPGVTSCATCGEADPFQCSCPPTLEVGREYVSAGGTGMHVRVEEDCGDHYRVEPIKPTRMPGAKVIFKAAAELWEPVA